MEDHIPRPKNNCRLKPSPPLPLIKTEIGVHRFRGHFNDFCVTISDLDDAKNLISMGYFGKATMSRNYPQFHSKLPEITRRRCIEHRKRFTDPLMKVGRKTIVMPDSNSEDEQYFKDLVPKYEFECSGIKECVNLSLEEAFFLADALQCIDISHKGNVLSTEQLWSVFTQSDKYFVQNYIVYYYFRSRNWVVKSGIKFAGDFLLYKQGPPFYHASFVVLISVVDQNLVQIKNLNRRSLDTRDLVGLNRLCETANKEVLVCEIIWPHNLDTCNIKAGDLSKFTVKETVMKRWIPSQERQANASTKTQ